MKKIIIELLEQLDSQFKDAKVDYKSEKLGMSDYTQIIVDRLDDLEYAHKQEINKLNQLLIDLKDELNYIFSDLKKQIDKLENMYW